MPHPALCKRPFCAGVWRVCVRTTRACCLRPSCLRLISMAAAVSLLLGSGHAVARRCDPTDNDRLEATRVIHRIQGMETHLADALRLQTGQLSGYIAQGATASIAALGGHARAGARTAREAAETGQVIAHAPSATGCRVITGMTGLGPAETVAHAVAADASERETARLAGDADSLGYPAGADATMRYRRIRRHYPENRDIRFDSLFGTDSLPTDEARATALDYGRNLVAPVAEAALPDDLVTSPGEHRRYLERRARDARAGLAAAWTTRALADRTPAVELAAWAEAIAPGTGSGTGALSSRALRRVLAVHRFNPDYLTGLNGLGSEELLREIIRNQALALRLAAARHDLAEHHGAIAAAILAVLNEDSRYRPVAPPVAAGIE